MPYSYWFLVTIRGGRQSDKTQKPNIVFIFADDFSYSAISSMGNTKVQTLYLTELADRGATF